jgi:hypothetical protein
MRVTLFAENSISSPVNRRCRKFTRNLFPQSYLAPSFRTRSDGLRQDVRRRPLLVKRRSRASS